ncbi:hypothetical protein B9Z55_015480 [Caenorhabditis nigoni]|uniref:Uncharacterized protein n=1 Tax=Caenorhabditis nigoni TaxID=1611254 RepID=A0A2G5UAF1_9PELO|nr:hypothetical protein B9Z55_015480 [Caenorhabditis nigoni]
MDNSESLDADHAIDRMVDQGTIRHRTIERAMRYVHRCEFVSRHQRLQQFLLPRVFPIHHGPLERMSQMDIHCKVAEHLRIEKGMKVLNVGSGSGFFSTVLGILVGDQGTNHGLEIYPKLIKNAESRVQKWVQKTASTAVGFSRPVFKSGDFNDPELWKRHLDMYDRIYISFVNHDLDCLRRALCMLKINGILIAPMNGWLCRYTRTTATNANCEFLERMSFSSGFLLPDGNSPPTPQFDRIAPLSILCRQALRTKLRSEIYNHHVITRINVSLRVPIGGVPDRSDGRPLLTLDVVYFHPDEGPSTSGPQIRRIRETIARLNSESSAAELQHQVWAELTSRDRAVRIRAANALGALHGPDALREAIETIESDECRDQRCVRYIQQGRLRHNLGAGVVASENSSQILANALIIHEAIRESKELFPKGLVEYGYMYLNRFNKLISEVTDSRKQVAPLDEVAQPYDPIDVRIGEKWDQLIANGTRIDLTNPWQFGFITQLKINESGSLTRMIEDFFAITRNFQNLMGLEEAPAPEMTVTELSARVLEQFSQICQLWERYLKLLVIERQPHGRFGDQERDDLRGRVHRIRTELFVRCPEARPEIISETEEEFEIRRQMELENQTMREISEMAEEFFSSDSEASSGSVGDITVFPPTLPSSNGSNAQESSASQRLGDLRSEDYKNTQEAPMSGHRQSLEEGSGPLPEDIPVAVEQLRVQQNNQTMREIRVISSSSSSSDSSDEDQGTPEPSESQPNGPSANSTNHFSAHGPPNGSRPPESNGSGSSIWVPMQFMVPQELNQEANEPLETEFEESEDSEDSEDPFNPMDMAFPEGPMPVIPLRRPTTPPRIPRNERSLNARRQRIHQLHDVFGTQVLEQERRQLDRLRYHPEEIELLRALRTPNIDPEELERRQHAYAVWIRAQRQNGVPMRRNWNLRGMDQLIPEPTEERIRMWQDTFNPQLVNRGRNLLNRVEAIQQSPPPDPTIPMDIDFEPLSRLPRVSGDLSDDEIDQEEQELEHRFLAYEAARRLEDQSLEDQSSESESEELDPSEWRRGFTFFGHTPPRIQALSAKRQAVHEPHLLRKKRERQLRERNVALRAAHNSYSNRIQNLQIPEGIRRFLVDLTEKIDFE